MDWDAFPAKRSVGLHSPSYTLECNTGGSHFDRRVIIAISRSFGIPCIQNSSRGNTGIIWRRDYDVCICLHTSIIPVTALKGRRSTARWWNAMLRLALRNNHLAHRALCVAAVKPSKSIGRLSTYQGTRSMSQSTEISIVHTDSQFYL